jgi:hypothetical protein
VEGRGVCTEVLLDLGESVEVAQELEDVLAVDVGAVVHAADKLLHHDPLNVGLGHVQQLRNCSAHDRGSVTAHNARGTLVVFVRVWFQAVKKSLFLARF